MFRNRWRQRGGIFPENANRILRPFGIPPIQPLRMLNSSHTGPNSFKKFGGTLPLVTLGSPAFMVTRKANLGWRRCHTITATNPTTAILTIRSRFIGASRVNHENTDLGSSSCWNYRMCYGVLRGSKCPKTRREISAGQQMAGILALGSTIRRVLLAVRHGTHYPYPKSRMLDL